MARMGDATVRLRGVTWDHPRGYDPLVATAEDYGRVHPGVEIKWEKRSLQAFADQSLDYLASNYDLLVIDHPHVGTAAHQNCLAPLDRYLPAAALDVLRRQSVGRSHDSYEWDGRQWALAIDAAAHVAAWRPDLLSTLPSTWSEVLDLAREGRVLWPLKPVDSICSFFTLAANRATPCATGQSLISEEDGLVVLETMLTMVSHLPTECLTMDPIQALDWLSDGDTYAYCPLLFGYSNYSRPRFRKNLIRFGNIPNLADQDSRGAILGGTGIAISASCSSLESAIDYVSWIAGADSQRGPYFRSGGQPANDAAWDDDTVNSACSDFFRDTRKTLDGSWLRPRHKGFIDFQDRAGDIVNHLLRSYGGSREAVRTLNQEYQRLASPGTGAAI